MLTCISHEDVIVIEVNYCHASLFCYDFAIFALEKIDEDEIVLQF